MTNKKKHIKLDAINRKIIERIHANASLTNQQLAEEIGLSAPACSHRVTALKEAGYFFNFHCEVDLERTFRHVLAYVEFRLSRNDLDSRRQFEREIEKHPEFMDCLRLSGEVDYISFTCSKNIDELNRLCDLLCENTGKLISRLDIRIILERAKWYLGYPLAKLEWLE